VLDALLLALCFYYYLVDKRTLSLEILQSEGLHHTDAHSYEMRGRWMGKQISFSNDMQVVERLRTDYGWKKERIWNLKEGSVQL